MSFECPLKCHLSLCIYLVAWICTIRRVFKCENSTCGFDAGLSPFECHTKILHTLVIYAAVVKLKTLSLFGTLHMVQEFTQSIHILWNCFITHIIPIECMSWIERMFPNKYQRIFMTFLLIIILWLWAFFSLVLIEYWLVHMHTSVCVIQLDSMNAAHHHILGIDWKQTSKYLTLSRKVKGNLNLYIFGKLYVINDYFRNKYRIYSTLLMHFEKGKHIHFDWNANEIWMEEQTKHDQIKAKPPNDQHNVWKPKMNHRQGVASLSSAVFHLHNACAQNNANWMRVRPSNESWKLTWW